ncbi:RNA methyltransferase [Varunaivibrio sulfuroxidans]|uniref:SpoU rRNA methylase family protein n=1 Tax=Varunaivibrio sulfuroxidans TaxID=1773489 RepID=A0A4R3JHG4_9PROT|nr:RNA methyltransferase [Varunaivibrio sulfuroxidans]TCS64783.1 SpoU rRNA methylase family protein [Varunaivibrio sulfuroxidans]WES32217.1 RNA methyltransferase [Varunaivibrio sulfuroxidans]
MRGYFAIGAERINKAMNVGAIFRTAHAFGASFVFTVAGDYARPRMKRADTSDAAGHVPYYAFPDLDHMILPAGCTLVGIELTDDAVDLPSFTHPGRAAYVLGPERGSLSPEMTARCAHIIKIPTRFCINVSLAAAIVMYDRTIALGRFAPRPMRPGGPTEDLPEHVHGGPIFRTRAEPFREAAPTGPGFDDPSLEKT